ncbi:hypothetical protein [Rhodococcus sp. NPDC060176]|uniref:hypothetical protein n=1 Tax=Rhodococcus sp. NPDC060176 TaxID=3347062 RepID=UPI00364D34BC
MSVPPATSTSLDIPNWYLGKIERTVDVGSDIERCYPVLLVLFLHRGREMDYLVLLQGVDQPADQLVEAMNFGFSSSESDIEANRLVADSESG